MWDYLGVLMMAGRAGRGRWSCGWPGVGVLVLEALLCVAGSTRPEFSEFGFATEPADTIVVRDQPAILNCSAHHATETPTMQWIRDSVFLNLEGDSRRQKLSNGSLYFSHIVHSRSHRPDEGIYQCVASVNTLGSIVSRKAKLQVAYMARTFRAEPQDLQVHLGATAMFACQMDGAPEPTVRWYKDELELDTEHVNYRVHTDGVLEIGSVQASDLGKYKCQAENSERSRTSREATLSQDTDRSTYQGVPPRFVLTPSDQVAIKGETVMLYCAANGRDRQGQVPVISWLKDGVTIDMSNLDSRFSLVGHGSLQIREVDETDSGSYTCRASNQEDSVDADASFIVHVPPIFKKRPHNVFAHTNADVEFECIVHGVPKPTIQWMKNGDILVPSDYFQILDGSHLRILGLVNSDEGLYQCLAENEVGNIQASAQLVILQGETPLPTSSLLTTPLSRNRQNHHTGASVDDNAELPSAPTDLVAAIVSTRFVTLSWRMPLLVGSSEIIAYSVFWREEGSDRERVLNSTSMQANIQHLKPATKYEFRVIAFNREGPSREAAEITVETQAAVHVPDRPSNLVVTPLSSTSILVKWAPPSSQNGPITHYRLYYYPDGGQEESDVEVSGTEHTLRGLQKFTDYSFRVAAFNSNGPGMGTEEVNARTYSDVPSEPPQNVTLETASSTSIIVHWEPPPDESKNGIITGYKIRYKLKSKGRRGDTVTTDGNRRAYALTDLNRDQEYSVRIQAMTVNGSSPATEWLSTETFMNDLDETILPGLPSSLAVRAMTSAIAVSWTPPKEHNIMVRGYILGYGIGIPDVFQQVLEAKQRYYNIKDLRPSSEYVISLRAFNNMGEGQIIYETVVTREETTPEPVTPMIPPVGLKAIVISPTTIVVTWSDTTLGRNQRITDNRYYTIRYHMRAGRKNRYTNSTDLNAHIDDLRPNTEYEFSVKVIKGRRQSTWSLSVLNKTFETAPATAPRDLTPVAVEGKPTWISLNWQPPRQPNGQITGYLVFYTTDATQRDRDWVVEPVLGDRLSTVIRDLTPETTYYFKVQARNSKGNGPMSPTVIFRTPKADGTGGGPIETPADYGQKINYNNKGGQVSQNRQNTVPPMVLWIVIGVICGITAIAVAVAAVIVCRKRSYGNSNKRKSGYMPANKGVIKGGPKDIKPPDLWIHDMEMKSIDKNNPESTMTVTPIRRKSQDMKGDEGCSDMDKRRNSFINTEHSYDSLDEERYRRPTRGKPMIMIPVDQPPPPREPIATAIPNGHLVGPDSTSTPIRPVHPRTQYPPIQPPYTASPPRVHAGDIGPPPGSDDHMSTAERRRAKDKHRRHSASRSGSFYAGSPHPGLTNTLCPQSPDSPSSHNQHAPIPYEQLQQQQMAPLNQSEGSKTLPHRPTNPLKSFSVPGPPTQSAPTTPTQKHIGTPSQSNAADSPPIVVTPGSCAAVKPQQQQPQQGSPYKKPPPPTTTPTPSKVRSPMPVVTPKAPDVTVRSGDKTDTELPKSYSAEELSAEMANLEGLMKDLNAITQQEFEC